MKIVLVLFGLIICSTSICQESWTLEKCIEYAINNNLKIKESQLNVDISNASIKQTSFNFVPTLQGYASHGYNWGQRIDPFTNTFATNQVRSNNFYLSSSATLFSGLQNYYIKQQAITDHKDQQYSIEIIQRNLRIDVTAAYLQVLLNREILSSYSEQLKLTLQQKERTKILINANRKTTSDILEIEAQLSLDKLNVTKAENDIKTVTLVLRQLINLPNETDFSIVTDSVNQGIIPILAIETSSLIEMQQAQGRLNSSNNALQIAKGGVYPRLSVNAYVGTGFSGNNKELNNSGEVITKLFNQQLDENLYQAVNFSMNIPILDRHQAAFNIQRSKIEVEKAKINQETTKRILENNFAQLRIDIENAKAEVESSKKFLKFAQLSADNAKLRFENGVINFTAFNEINTKLFVAQSNLIQAKFKYDFKNKLMLIYSE